MSGAAIAAAGSIYPQRSAYTVTSTQAAANDTACGVSITNSGDFVYDSSSFGVISTINAPSNWYYPTTGMIGNNYWVRYTLLSGTNPSGGSMVNGTIHALTTAKNMVLQRLIGAGAGTTTCTVLVEIFTDSGGLYVVRSYVITMNCVKT